MYKKIAVVVLVVVLSLVNWLIYEKELQIKNDKTVYLKLAPVDPRSLMQGDYMRLRFEMAEQIKKTFANDYDYGSNDGFVLVNLDDKKVASFVKIYKDGEKISVNQLILQYRQRGYDIKFATNAFFFQEGQGEKYEKAKYGEFKVNKKGGLLLVNMFDENLKKI